MAILNLEYYTQKDLYSDGDIEEQMLKMAKEGVTCEDLSSEQVSFPVIYHFSDLRANILNWYPIKKSDSVLEIGAGCGAITGTICEKAGQVTSVELSKRRAQINYYRNEKKDNLTIMVGNLNDMDLGQQYDYVVVNGVLEYAMSFTEGDTPYETFLGKMGSYLKNTGKVLIAIENKLGMKYFAGASGRSYGHSLLWNQWLSGKSQCQNIFQNRIAGTCEKKRISFSKILLPVSGL